METRANYALIGFFTLAIVAAGFAFVLWFSGTDKPASQQTFRIVFSGSVSGLSRGSQVLFNGLRVGEVTKLDLRDDDPSQVAAQITVDKRIPMKADTHAQLEFSGLTGIASVALKGGSLNAPPLLAEADGSPATIFADRSDFQNILTNLQNLSAKADAFIDKADRILGDNSGDIRQTVNHVEVFTKSLSDNADGINKFLAGMTDLGNTIKPLTGKLETLTNDVDAVVRSVDPSRVRNIVASADRLLTENSASLAATLKNTEAFSRALSDNSDGIRQAFAAVSDIGNSIKPLADRLNTLSDNANKIVAAVDPEKVRSTVDDAGDTAKTLRAASTKVDALLDNLNGFLKNGDSKSLFADVGEAAKSIRKLADNLDIRTKDLAAGLKSFTGPGLRQYEQLAVDGRRTVDELNRAVRSLERNPSQIIFGGKPSIPEYSGTR